MTITRISTNERMSQAVINGDTIYLSGQVAIEASGESVTQQTQNILNRIETLLEESGSNKENLLTAMIWLANMNDFNEMNEVWDSWVPYGNAPTRACVESRLASSNFALEISVTAVRIL